MRTMAITVISLALVTLYACSDNDNDLTASDDNGGAGSGQAGSAAQTGSAGSSRISGSAGDETQSAGSATLAGAASTAEAGAADTAGTAGTPAGGGGTTSTAGGGGTTSTAGGGGTTSTAGGGGTTNTAGGGGTTNTAGGAGRGAGDDAAGAGGANAGQVPVAPTALAIDTTTSAFTVGVSWTDAATDVTGFNVYLSTDDSKPATPTAVLAAGTLAYGLNRVMAGQTYRAWVEAVNAAGVSTAAQLTAAAPTPDLIWDSLYYDETAGNVDLAVEDGYGLLSDQSDVSNLYAYHSASPTLTSAGAAQLLDPTFTYPVASSDIDPTVAQYFWVEARGTSGSLFSMRSLAPANTVSNLQASADASSATLTWDATPGATAYEVFYGTGSIAAAARLPDTTTTTALVPSLTASTAYSFWVRARAAALGGSGFPGQYGVAQATTSQ